MKNWQKLVAGATLVVACAVNAQSAQERKKLTESMDVGAIEQLAEQFQAQFELAEAQVQKYLRENPTVQRSREVNGRTQTIVRIDASGNPVYQVGRDGTVSGFDGPKNLASGQLIKADSLYSGGSVGVNITGTSMVAGVWEPGIPRVTHELISGKVTVASGQSAFAVGGNGDHASHVTGTMIGRNVATRPSARGIAFDATSTNYDAINDLTEMTSFAASAGLVSNHSYGDANTQTTDLWKYGAYDAEARDWDVLLKTATSYLPFIAGGNEQTSSGNVAKAGYDIMTGPATSKNTMTVGAVNGDKTMSSYSNWGPTDDGRVKPEIVAKGTGIDSAQSASDSAYSGPTTSGTSYASPAAAASGLLLQQYFNSLNGRFMRSSTLKALMLGTAEDLGQQGPDHKFGWGLLNVEAAANAIKKNGAVGSAAASRGAAILERTTNPPADSTSEESFTIFAKGGVVPLVINMAWIDDEGPAQSGPTIDDPTSRLVYEFDMKVSGGMPSTDKWPWRIPSMAKRTLDATVGTQWFDRTGVDGTGTDSNGSNFKQIIVNNPTVDGQYTVSIRKRTGSPADVRSLSFVITGLKETVAGPAVLNIDGSDAATRYGAATDGVLLIRYLLGYRDAALTAGALGGSPTRDAAQIATYLGGLGTQLDVDGDGQVYAFTDGLLILRRMLGLSGAALTTGAKVGARSDADIANAIDLLKP